MKCTKCGREIGVEAELGMIDELDICGGTVQYFYCRECEKEVNQLKSLHRIVAERMSSDSMYHAFFGGPEFEDDFDREIKRCCCMDPYGEEFKSECIMDKNRYS